MRRQGGVDVVGLMTTITEEYGRVSMHGVRREVLERQAELAGLPVVAVGISAGASNAEYERAFLSAALRAKAEWGIGSIVFGDLFLEDVRAYREHLLDGTGIEPVFPLWGRPTASLAREMVAGGLRAEVVCVDPARLPAEFAGRSWDASLLADLPAGVDPCGENGEFHTCVTAGPMLSEPIAVRRGERVLRDGFVFSDLFLEGERPARQAAC